jgi:hypothetical protein
MILARSPALHTACAVEVAVGVKLGVGVPVGVAGGLPIVPLLQGSPAVSFARITFPSELPRLILRSVRSAGGSVAAGGVGVAVPAANLMR